MMKKDNFLTNYALKNNIISDEFFISTTSTYLFI